MTPNVVCIIQARMASQRFPGKVLETIRDSSTICTVYRRTRKAGYHVVIAIPATDSELEATILQWFRLGDSPVILRPGLSTVFKWDGPENDVLNRYAACAREYKADVVVRITGDCPLVDPVAIQGQVKRLLDTGAMYVSNIYPVRTVPSGFDVEVFTATALYVADALATEPHDREHVTPWIRLMFAADGHYTVLPETVPHLSLDTPEDLALIRRVAEKMP
jgi:spore coat polysaccharide biosynthesis protein SpsF (cytidylyltransferase family)